MTARLTLALVLAVGPCLNIVQAADGVPRDPEPGCARTVPTTILVHRIHRKGSSRPARVERVPFRLYVERVMASGAWPAYKPMESLKAGALVIAARAWWHVCHPQPGYVRDGHRYDIHDGSPRKALRGRADGGQLYRGAVPVHSRIRRAVAAVWGVRLVRRGRQAKPRWTGDGGRCGQSITGNRLPEDSVTRCARLGWSWQRIVRVYMPRTRVVVP